MNVSQRSQTRELTSVLVSDSILAMASVEEREAALRDALHKTGQREKYTPFLLAMYAFNFELQHGIPLSQTNADTAKAPELLKANGSSPTAKTIRTAVRELCHQEILMQYPRPGDGGWGRVIDWDGVEEILSGDLDSEDVLRFKKPRRLEIRLRFMPDGRATLAKDNERAYVSVCKPKVRGYPWDEHGQRNLDPIGRDGA